jgi:hypothetical protein
LALAWIENAKYVTELTKDPEAKYLYDYLQKYAVIGMPNRRGSITTIRQANIKDPKHNFFLMPFLEVEKADPHFQWKSCLDSGGNFSLVNLNSKFIFWLKNKDNVRVLTLPVDLSQCNRLVSGLILLHEIRHASDFSVQKNFNENLCQFEPLAYGLNTQLLEKIGGEAYLDLVRKEAPFRKEITDLSVDQFFRVNPQLTLLFGPFKSHADKHLIRTLFLMDLDVVVHSPSHEPGAPKENILGSTLCGLEHDFGNQSKQEFAKSK